MSAYYPPYHSYYNPVISKPIYDEWSPFVQVQNPVYIPVPMLVSPPIVAAPVYSHAGGIFTGLPPIVTDAISVGNLQTSYVYEPLINYSNEIEITHGYTDSVTSESPVRNIVEIDNKVEENDPLEYYLKLPKQLFPTARMLKLDPNAIINEFCKLENIHYHTHWILDLEFGIQRIPVTRQIPIYNVKFNSIHCKNTPDAIHPGFEVCDDEFKKVFLFYYDCIISSWYRGYMIQNNDTSVDNFQAWLQLPMQTLGMCWS